MGDVWMELQKTALLDNQDGQSVLEYLLLLIVIISLVAVVFRSDAFKSVFGSQSPVFDSLRDLTKFSYRHGHEGRDSDSVTDNSYGSIHELYTDRETGGSRFFISIEAYGQ